MAILRPLRVLRAPSVALDDVSCEGDACDLPAPAGPPELLLHVEGLVCGVCAGRAAGALRSVPGVASAEVDLDSGQARLVLDEGAEVELATLQDAVEGVVVGMRVRRWIERAVHGAAEAER